MKIKCFFFGHKISEENEDCGYAVCERCKAHEYYDSSFLFNIPNFFHWVKFMVKNRIIDKIYTKCNCCGKACFLFNKEVGSHKDCLPF